jgi:phosphonopyruvate decarboxylase
MDLLGLMKQAGIGFFSGVPDSSLEAFCWDVCRDPGVTHVAAACEGGAVALAAGHWIATGRVAAAYMQNSGIANALNPLMSLASADAYDIPVLLVVGWRGRPGSSDEPQHRGVGRDTLALLRLAGIEPWICEAGDDEGVRTYLQRCLGAGTRGALLVPPGLATGTGAVAHAAHSRAAGLGRDAVLACVADAAAADGGLIVSGIGHAGRAMMGLRRRRGEDMFVDLPAVGGMGHAAMLATGIALGAPGRRVYCLDGDGALLMHLGNQAVLGARPAIRLTHVLLDNGCHQSVGGQPLVHGGVDYPRLARALGYPLAETAASGENLAALLHRLSQGGCGLVHVPVAAEGAGSLPRPDRPLPQGLAAFRARHALAGAGPAGASPGWPS